MNTKIEYRWETKEEQEQYWKECEEVNIERHEYFEKSYKNQGERYYSNKDCDLVVQNCHLGMKNYIQLNTIDWAICEAECGIKVAEKNLSKLKNVATIYLFLKCVIDFYWVLDGKESEDNLKKLVNFTDEMFAKTEKIKKFQYIDFALINIKYGDFEKAKKFISYVYEVKPKSKLSENVIYHLERFYAFVIEYLLAPEINAELLPKLTACFKLLFNEEQKGSKKLYDEFRIDLTLKYHVFGLRYIWYKYFSGRDWDTISPIEVIQSERYGVKGLQDC